MVFRSLIRTFARMIDSLTYYIYGMSTMFYVMMAWMFWRRGRDVLSRLFSCLMMLTCVECLKDLLIFVEHNSLVDNVLWNTLTAIDVIVIPFYNFILKELVRPGWLTWKRAVVHEMFFVILLVALFVTGSRLCYLLLVAWSVIYGLGTLFVSIHLIGAYNRQLKSRFSYQENINLHWLRGILFGFLTILVVWALTAVERQDYADNIYMVCSLVLWMTLSYFLYRHESVIDELTDTETADEPLVDETERERGTIACEVQRLFYNDRLYLNPKLKLSDVATMVGTNRTYLSRYFNRENGQTFYDYVNKLRISHAEHLLQTTNLPLMLVAEQSGFNSLSTFRRVFSTYHDCSPAEFRKQDATG